MTGGVAHDFNNLLMVISSGLTMLERPLGENRRHMIKEAMLQAVERGSNLTRQLLGFSRNLREEMKPHGIKVTAVMPGAAYTDSWSSSGIDPSRFMEAQDIAEMIYVSSQLSAGACVEDIILRPQLGDI